jgi:Transposase DDE domain
MPIFARIATAMQALVGPVAEQVGQQCRLICRQRKFTAATLVQTFVLGYLRKPTASSDDLALTAQQLGVDVSSQAIDRRFQPALRDCLHNLWQHAVAQVVMAKPRAVALLQKFTAVLIGDSTTIQLADTLAQTYPGCGGRSGLGQAALKIQVLWDVLCGSLRRARLEAGRQSDATSPAVEATPQPGALLLYDLGFFALERLRHWSNASAYWISRVGSQVTIYVGGVPSNLLDWLAQATTTGPIDRWVEVGEKQRLPCRLIALRAPDEVANRRRQKAYAKAAKKGRVPSRAHLAACAWTLYLTNVPEAMLRWREVVVLYRVRWQIELLFKLWKSHNQLATHRSTDPVRQLVELYARLVAVIVQHWLVLSAGWEEGGLSLVKAARCFREHVPLLVEALDDLPRLIAVLRRLAGMMKRLARLNRRRKHPSTQQLIEHPELLEYET